MKKLQRFTTLAFSLLLFGCQSSSSEQPALDTGMIKTEAVQTAVAEMTVQAILNPTSNAIIQTDIPADKMGETPEPLPTQIETPGKIIASPTAPLPEPVYACNINLSLSLPVNGPQPAGAEITKKWVVKNTGNVAWNSENVKFKWVGGVNLSDSDSMELQGVIKPGDTQEFTMIMQLPEKPSNRNQIIEWGLVNQENQIFCKLYYLISSTY
jgi:hypothetical protein